MYFVTGGRKTQSALYRVHYIKPIPTSRKLSTHEIYRKMNGEGERLYRKQFESFHDITPPKDVTEANLKLPGSDKKGLIIGSLNLRTKRAEQYAWHHHPELFKKSLSRSYILSELIYKFNPKISEDHLKQLNHHALNLEDFLETYSFMPKAKLDHIYAFGHAMEQSELRSEFRKYVDEFVKCRSFIV
mgnify:CR=1 FL=1